jgi:hypothetical protein
MFAPEIAVIGHVYDQVLEILLGEVFPQVIRVVDKFVHRVSISDQVPSTA